MSSYSSSLSSSYSGSPTSSSASLSFHHHVSSSRRDTGKIGDEMGIIRTWFSVLDDSERSSALHSIAELPSLREIEPMIQALKDRKRELWRQQEELIIQPPVKPKWIMPVFPHNSQDPRWAAKWLRALRLHKYERCLLGMSPAQVSCLEDEDLQQLGIDTVGVDMLCLIISRPTGLVMILSSSRISMTSIPSRTFHFHTRLSEEQQNQRKKHGIARSDTQKPHRNGTVV